MSDVKEIQSMDDVPNFATDEEEREFWATHSLGEDVPLIPREQSDQPLPRAAPQPSGTRLKGVHVKLEPTTLKRLKFLAKRRGVGYQTLLKRFVDERLYEEEKREGII